MIRIYIIIISVFIATSIDAKMLYVDRINGNDSVTYAANDENSPWATIGRAAWGSTSCTSQNSSEAAQAGDTVNIDAGTYAVNRTCANSRATPTYNPANSGSSGNLITFIGIGNVYLTQTGNTGPIIGADARNYIVWDNFIIDESNITTQADTGPVAFFSATFSTIQNSEIIGTTVPWSDNHKGIAIQGISNYITVRNNKIHGFYYGPSRSNDNNGVGIQVYNSYNLTIENNEIYDSASGIALKELIMNPTGTHYIRYNLIYDIGNVGLRFMRLESPQTTYAYQNIVRDSTLGIRFHGFNGGVPANVYVVNNTIDNTTNGGIFVSGLVESTNNVVQNNIITNSASAINAEDVSQCNLFGGTANIGFDYNQYYTYNTFYRCYYSNNTYASWQSSYSQDSNSITSDPSYLDEIADNFRLNASSTARNAGIDILDLDNDGSTSDPINAGAYITGSEQIGLTTAPSLPTKIPSPPTSVTVTQTN